MIPRRTSGLPLTADQRSVSGRLRLRATTGRIIPNDGEASPSTKALRKYSMWSEGVCRLPDHIKDPMRIFCHYHCDCGHQWTVQRQHTEDEQPSDLICPEGHPAITGRVELPVDDVQVLISPAARVVDQVKQQRILNGRCRATIKVRRQRQSG
jgi:hypothetical protein